MILDFVDWFLAEPVLLVTNEPINQILCTLKRKKTSTNCLSSNIDHFIPSVTGISTGKPRLLRQFITYKKVIFLIDGKKTTNQPCDTCRWDDRRKTAGSRSNTRTWWRPTTTNRNWQRSHLDYWPKTPRARYNPVCPLSSRPVVFGFAVFLIVLIFVYHFSVTNLPVLLTCSRRWANAAGDICEIAGLGDWWRQRAIELGRMGAFQPRTKAEIGEFNVTAIVLETI